MMPHQTKKDEWRLAWSQKVFRKKTAIVLALNIVVLVLFSSFFRYIEKRKGIQLNDIVLQNVPAINVSIFIFIIIWSTALLIFIRAIQRPEIFLTFLFSFFFVSITRILTISFVPLDPPHSLIPLVDPISSIFYGGSFITKDLFYSGHIATQFLIFLCLKKRTDKVLAAISTFSVAMLLLVQHVHYSIDILAAPFAAYLCFFMGRIVAKNGIQF